MEAKCPSCALCRCDVALLSCQPLQHVQALSDTGEVVTLDYRVCRFHTINAIDRGIAEAVEGCKSITQLFFIFLASALYTQSVNKSERFQPNMQGYRVTRVMILDKAAIFSSRLHCLLQRTQSRGRCSGAVTDPLCGFGSLWKCADGC